VRGSLPTPRPTAPSPHRPRVHPSFAPVRREPEDDDMEPLSDVERDHIMRALHRADGNKKKAATILGLSRRALYRKLERLDLGVMITRRGKGAA